MFRTAARPVTARSISARSISARSIGARSITAVAVGLALFAGLPAVGASAAEKPGIASAMPSATTTGVPAGTVLKPYQGDLKITTPGTVIDGLEIFGFVRVEAANVTIKNTIIRGRTATSNVGLIYAVPGVATNLMVKDTELAPAVPQVYITGIYGANFTLARVNIHHVVDGVHIFGDTVRVYDSWIHDMSHFDHDPAHKGGPTHDDDIQIQKGTDIWIHDNLISGAANAVMQVTQGQGKVSRLLFENNQITGGACSINVSQVGAGTAIERLNIRDNLFGTSKYNCDAIVDSATYKIMTMTNNARLDGKALRVNER